MLRQRLPGIALFAAFVGCTVEGSDGDRGAGAGGAAGSAGASDTGGSGGASAGTGGGGTAGSMPQELVSCDPNLITCRVATPECEEGHVPSVDGNCYGDCVPVERCACTGPAQCPDSDHYTCHMSAGRCGPYVR
jgi:hypothetical protein